MASLVCTIAMAADLLHGLRNKKFWFHVKLPVDLTSETPGEMDQVAKLGSRAFLCTIMVNLMPSLASMDNNTLLVGNFSVIDGHLGNDNLLETNEISYSARIRVREVWSVSAYMPDGPHIRTGGRVRTGALHQPKRRQNARLDKEGHLFKPLDNNKHLCNITIPGIKERCLQGVPTPKAKARHRSSPSFPRCQEQYF
ncbi:hypothetical protein Tco_0645284 [Tanacetum coccineum]